MALPTWMTILEWSTYQSAAITGTRLARLLFARKTRSFVERLGLLDSATTQAILTTRLRGIVDRGQSTNQERPRRRRQATRSSNCPPPLVRGRKLSLRKIEKKPGTCST